MGEVGNGERENILGVGISAVNMRQALEVIDGWIQGGDRQYLCLAAVHSVLDCQGSEALRAIFNLSGLTTPDGMSLVWLLRMRGHRNVSRVYGPDLMLAVCDFFNQVGAGHYFLGGEPGVSERLAERLAERVPGLNVCGAYSPPFRELTVEEDAQLVEDINSASPDFLWVGLGSPKQERWMAEHRHAIHAPVMIAVGAAFDFLSGRKLQAPRWVQRSGLEWLFRAGTEPRRLWRRYAEYPRFLVLLILQLAGLKRFELEV
jgi:N-acetylglucosaminyldiphosphoundecaprenol N-acetyl-beta-D-mannosaminyltransferase